MTDENRVTDETGDGRRIAVDRSIEPAAPDEFGLVQVWWGNGKGKTTAAIGMGVRAAGHGYRVHAVQFMKGGTYTVEDVRGELNALSHVPGFTVEHTGHYGWHGFGAKSTDEDHGVHADAGFERVRELIDSAGDVDLTAPIPLDAPPEAGVHMLILDEILYAVHRDLVDEAVLLDLVESKPSDLELVLTGGHREPTFLTDHVDLVTEVRKHKHPIEAGQPARKGTEY